MPPLELKPADACQYDLVSLGEIMLRLDPGETRIHTTRQFRAWEGGGEYNVARGLRRCFGLRTAVVTAFVDNAVGRLLEDLVLQGGVSTEFVRWAADDGIGRTVRNGLNFTERGYGVRGAVGVSDRGNSAASQLKPGDIDWDDLFGRRGVRWFHTGGIFAALSATTPPVVIEAVRAAKKHGVVVSYDLNYRPSLWKSIGGLARCQEVNQEIASFVDVMIGNEEDFTACLGFEVEGADANLAHIEIDSFKRMIEQALARYPNFQATATTLRAVKSATINDWGAVVWHDGPVLRIAALPRAGNHGPRRRRRQFCLGPDLRVPDGRGSAGGGGLRRGARSPGDDDSRRHVDGDVGGSQKTHGWRQRAGGEIESRDGRYPLARNTHRAGRTGRRPVAPVAGAGARVWSWSWSCSG